MTDFNNSNVELIDPVKVMLLLAFVAILVERALYAIYETPLWCRLIKNPLKSLGIDGLKLYVAIGVNVALAMAIHLDALAMVAGSEATTVGMLLTGLFTSGGSKAAADMFSAQKAIQDGKVRKANGG